jgi:hypothetical protein
MSLWRGVLVLFFPLWGFASHIHWLGSYDKALQKAIATHKPLLILVVDNSQKSNKTIRNQLMNQPYVDTIDNHFISVIVTHESVESYPNEMFYTSIFPTLFFVDSSNELFLRKPLYGAEITVDSLAKITRNLGIIPKIEKNSYPYYEKNTDIYQWLWTYRTQCCTYYPRGSYIGVGGDQ